MRKPLILITVGRIPQATPHGELQSIATGCDTDYVDSVVRAGGAPLILPCIDNEEAVRAAVHACDGIILTGGGDVVSLNYGEEPHEMSKYQDPVRDATELTVARMALELEIPILGICRGMQVLNVACGGTLVQDIPSQIPEAVKHYSQGMHTVLLHTVDVESGTLMERVFGAGSVGINSYHHQAVKDLGRGLRVNCRARDGVIEGMESADGKPLLAVQFHPEECAAAYPQFQTFFNWVVQEAQQRAVVSSGAGVNGVCADSVDLSSTRYG
jgi:putative glutamine amidotransferase